MGATTSATRDDRGKKKNPYLVSVDTVVNRPRCLEVLQHALLDLLGQAVDADEVLQVLHARVVQGAPGVHALDDGRHVPEDQRVHQCCLRRGGGGESPIH